MIGSLRVLFDGCRTCPEELNEAASSLIYAATRCGDFPELQEIRILFTSRYGKEFAARAVELRNNCGVNSKATSNKSMFLEVNEVCIIL